MIAAGVPGERKRRIATLALWSIVVAFVVLGFKAAAWWITGSVALYSDALESTVNVIAAFAAYWAIQVSHKPADDDHPFGHHKAEYFSAVLEGVLIVVAALLILTEVWRSWQNAAPLEQPWKGLAVNGVATIINGVFVALVTGLLRLNEIAEMTNIGTLSAFIVVAIGVWILRAQRPELKRGFTAPLLPLTATVTIVSCAYMMWALDGLTWKLFGAWCVIGLVVYFAYGLNHSVIRPGSAPDANAQV